MPPISPLPSLADRQALTRAHIALLHPPGSRGRVATARQTADGGWDEGMITPSSRSVDRQVAEAEVQFVSQARFVGRRNSARVASIGSGFLDLDYARDGLPFAHLTPEEVVAMVLIALDQLGIPRPSWFTFSGRGLHLVWRFDSLSGQALHRWQRAMKSLRGPRLDDAGNLPIRRGIDPRVAEWQARMHPLWQLLQGLGLDRGCCDVARVLRVWGSINPKTGTMARRAWPAASADVKSVSFDAWADAVCPYSRAEMRAIREQRSAEQASAPVATPAARRTKRPPTGNKWRLILDDLLALLDHRSRLDVGVRMRWAVVAATAISQIEGGDAEMWAERLAPLCGLPERELASAFSGVEAGMHAAAAGERREYEGKDRPAFYDWSYARIVSDLGISQDEADAAALLVLRPDGSRAGRSAAERQRDSRDARAPDRATRARQAEERLALGRFAWSLRQQGLTAAECASTLRRSRASIYEALREAEADIAENGVPMLALMWASGPMVAGSEEHRRAQLAEAEPAVAASATPADSAEAVVTADASAVPVHDESQRIVAPGPIEDPASPAAPRRPNPIPAGEVVETRYTPFYSEYRTATARWSILRVVERGGVEYEIREDLPLDDLAPVTAPVRRRTAADDARATAILGHVASETASARRASRRASSRIAARPGRLAPLDLATEARLYREASGR
ncbi:hypothetical protein MMB17_05705 [Methylobacterium organophilum]|uniref:hypothetical protein n=1 Tax=Methylobacterium organophilum TaxID=410 RepID=UPI001F12F74A|nr:hypothetical protein [Methylobacterium organophilum]UMY18812.1 hypothetical protein MMB17_05705 [Methylobacterium organophilum]